MSVVIDMKKKESLLGNEGSYFFTVNEAGQGQNMLLLKKKKKTTIEAKRRICFGKGRGEACSPFRNHPFKE